MLPQAISEGDLGAHCIQQLPPPGPELWRGLVYGERWRARCFLGSDELVAETLSCPLPRPKCLGLRHDWIREPCVPQGQVQDPGHGTAVVGGGQG